MPETTTPVGPCHGCGKPDAHGELIVGSVYTFICADCDREAEANWQAVVSGIAEKIQRGDFDGPMCVGCAHCGCDPADPEDACYVCAACDEANPE